MSAEYRHLILMARRPAFGLGKRRLAAGVGNLVAHRFQKFALAHLLRDLAADPRWRLWLALTPDRPLRLPGARRVIAQGGGDLGVRMQRLSGGLPSGAVVFIGSDTPQVNRGDIAAAFSALGRADAVFGPARDGGYWLIGFTQAQRRRLPFSDVRWSTRHTRADTLKNLTGKRVEMLRELEDVDDAESYARWREVRVEG